MLQCAFLQIVILIVSFSVGLLTLRGFSYISSEKMETFPIVLTSICGAITLTIALSYLHFLLPLNTLALQIIIVLISIINIYYSRKLIRPTLLKAINNFRNLPILYSSSLVIFILFICFQSSIQVQAFDAGTYHLPYIKWIEQFPVIKGLANVHSRFGFNYHYHLLYAFFGYANVFGTTIHALNGFFFLLCFIYFFELFATATLSVIKIVAVICLLYITQINKGMIGFSPDFPIAAIQMIITVECLRYLTGVHTIYKTNSKNFFLIVSWLCLGLISFKLAAVTIGFVYIIAFPKQIWKNKYFIILSSIIILAPFFYRNYLISGYLIYPLDSLDIFNVPWKLPIVTVIHERIVIKNWALGYPNFYNNGYTYNLAFFKQWLIRSKELNAAYIPVIFISLACTALFLTTIGYHIFRRAFHILVSPAYLLLYGLLCGIIFWWFLAPDLRFGNGVILPFIAIITAKAIVHIYPSINLKWASLTVPLLITCTALFAVSGKQISQAKTLGLKRDFNILSQPPYPKPDTVSVMMQTDKVFVTSSIMGGCWECPLPCNYKIGEYKFIEPGNIKAGFMPATKQ